MSIDELLLQLVGDDPDTLTPLFRQWIGSSRRFRSFAQAYQTKIRAKVRSAGDDEALQDLLFELEVAHWLLQEKRFHLAYEQQGLRAAPGPDFTVTFTTKASFHVEVTRIRSIAPEAGNAVSTPEAHAGKLLSVILGKLNQIKAGAANLLLIGLDPIPIAGSTIEEMMKQMKVRVENGDPTLLARSRLRTPGEFFKQYQALSGIFFYFFRPPALATPGMTASLLWLNKEAKYPLLTQVQTILRQLPSND